MEKDIRIEGDISIRALLEAKTRIDEILKEPCTDIVRDAAIKRFEFTYELVWKTLKKVLGHRGIDVNSPRQVFREAARERLVDSPEPWFDYVEKRNLTSHVYREEVAQEVYGVVPAFRDHVQAVIDRLRHHEEKTADS